MSQEQEKEKSPLERLLKLRDEYISRLDIGAAKIEEARSQGRDVTLWEDYWIQLLRQYGAVCEEVQELEASTGA